MCLSVLYNVASVSFAIICWLLNLNSRMCVDAVIEIEIMIIRSCKIMQMLDIMLLIRIKQFSFSTIPKKIVPFFREQKFTYS